MHSPLTSSDELAAIRQELNELRATVAAMRGNGHHNGNGHFTLETAESAAVTDRRGMLKKVAGLAVGVATVGLLKPSSSDAARAPSATGGNFLIGQNNAPTSENDKTGIVNPASSLAPVLFQSLNFRSTQFVSPGGKIALVGYSDNQGNPAVEENIFGVVGKTGTSSLTATSIGVYGESFAAPIVGSTAVRAVGVYGTSNGIGVYGIVSSLTSPGRGVEGKGYNGLYGTGDGDGNGVVGLNFANNTSAAGVFGQGSFGLGGYFVGGRAALKLDVSGSAVANPNLANPSGSSVGDVYRGSTNDSLWYRTSVPTNPYRKLAGSDTAGATHILGAPVRFIDTRNGTGGATGAFAAGEVRSYDFDALQPGVIPVGARGIFGNLTAASPAGNGNFQTNTSNSFPSSAAAVMSYRTGVNLSNHFVSALDASGLMFVKANISSVHLVLDIQGYYI